ncbi:hypothetical protein Syun_018218 [Stephania yunnanensis]|uniref:Autophagy-related protein 9 n=1 Tax=Stephania yunnanensis TaxID=152371 RepID=A0AAP0IU40_9MAGN
MKMSGRKKAANPFNIFKWWHRESSLNSRLLNDSLSEIELPDYHRLPSSGSESPSGLLNGESLKVEPIADLDLFFGRLYNYYCEKGLWCIIIKWIVELLSLGFTICFSGFFLLYVDWNGLRNAKCGIDAVGSGVKPCDLVKEALHPHPLTPFTLSTCIIVGYLGIISVYWILCFLRFFTQLKDTLEIRRFYYNSLLVTDREIQTTPWASILDKVIQVQRSQQLCVVRDLSAHDVVMRIMRKENYLIGMVNKGLLAFPISPWLPGAGPAIHSGMNGRKNHLILTKTLEWTLNWCILQSMFDRNFRIQRNFISNPALLKKRLMAVGLMMLILSPFFIIFMLVYLFLRHAEQFYNHPSTAFSRRWSNLSKWIFREFNEVDHLFEYRINSSIIHAANYVKQFPSPLVSIIAKFISFVSGGFTAILIIIAFLEESLLEGQIFGRNLLWYAAVFGAVTAISRAMVTDELQVLDPEGAMSLVVQYTHYMPKKWRGKENTDKVRLEFESLFQYTGKMLLEEMASIFLTPYLLLFIVPKRVDDILQFISEFTVDIEGVGNVCSLSVHDFEKHGNSNYASPYNAPRARRSSQGKLEKSFLSFQSSYPTWDPDTQGQNFLSTLRNFREQKLRGRMQQAYAHPTMWQLTPHLAGQDVFYNNNGAGYKLGSESLLDTDEKNHPYLLDWYYTSPRSHTADASRDIPSASANAAENPNREFWISFNDPTAPKGIRVDENWGFASENHRQESHLEASTSTPIFRESVLKHQSGHGEGRLQSHWWARSNPTSGLETSFIEPPGFENFYNNSKKMQTTWSSGLRGSQILVHCPRLISWRIAPLMMMNSTSLLMIFTAKKWKLSLLE